MGSHKKAEHQTFADIRHEVEATTEPRPTFESRPSLVHEREWVDPFGVRWHRRGGLLDLHQLRRLRKHPDLIVLHIDGPDEPQHVEGSEASDLLDDVHDFFREPSASGAEFWAAEFRDDAHRILLMVDQACW